MQYYSEVTKKLYKSIDELKKAESAVAEEAKKKDELKAKREARAKELEAAFENAKKANEIANQMLHDFIADYGSFHYTLKKDGNDNTYDGFKSIFDFLCESVR